MKDGNTLIFTLENYRDMVIAPYRCHIQGTVITRALPGVVRKKGLI